MSPVNHKGLYQRLKREKKREFAGCFEPSQPQRIRSGLKTDRQAEREREGGRERERYCIL